MEKIDKPIRILVTGGFGYVGGRVAQHLVEMGYQVVLGSRKKQSSPDWLPQSEVVQLRWNDESALSEICNSVNVVIHTAGMNAQDCALDPVAALEFNGLATAKLVRASRKAGVAKFIYFSTAHVYQSPLVGEINEDTCPRNLHPYAATHLAGENAVLSGSEIESDFTGIVLRLSNVIGAPVHKDVNCWMLVVNDLCRQALQSGRMKINSCGLQKRDFVSMVEVNRRINNILSGSQSIADLAILNVGSGVSISIKDIAMMIVERYKLMFGRLVSLEFIPSNNINADVDLEYKSFYDVAYSKKDVILDVENSIDEMLKFCDEAFKNV